MNENSIQKFILLDDNDELSKSLADVVHKVFPAAKVYWVRAQKRVSLWTPEDKGRIKTNHKLDDLDDIRYEEVDNDAAVTQAIIAFAGNSNTALILDLHWDDFDNNILRQVPWIREFLGRERPPKRVIALTSEVDLPHDTREQVERYLMRTDHLELPRLRSRFILSASGGGDRNRNEQDRMWELGALINDIAYRWECVYPSVDAPPALSFHKDPAINEVLTLYADCWEHNWDNWMAQVHNPQTRAFAHDHFNQDADMHVTMAKRWLSSGGKEVGYDQNSFKGLFMAGYLEPEDAAPCRVLNPQRAITNDILSAALTRLNIHAEFGRGVNYWNLPVIPGVAFLVSLKEFLTSLKSDDNAGAKQRLPPTSIRLNKWAPMAKGNSSLYELYCLMIALKEIPNDKHQGVGLMHKFLKSGSGASTALANLLVAHTVGIKGVPQAWHSLFQVSGAPLCPQVAGIRFIENGLEIFWWGHPYIRRE